MTSSTLRSSRFSMTVATGRRVPLNTQAPPTLPGTLSTAGHRDQSSAAMNRPPARLQLTGCRPGRHARSCSASETVQSPQPVRDLVPTGERLAHDSPLEGVIAHFDKIEGSVTSEVQERSGLSRL